MMAAGEKRLGFVALVCAVIALTACGSSNDPAVTAASSDEGAADASMSNGGSVSGEESSAGSVTPDAAPDSAALELPEGATRVGIVQIAQGLASPNGRMTTAEGRFVSVENVDRARTLLDTVRPPLDTCTVTRRVGGSASPGSANRGDPSLDAGDTIVFTAGFGTWLTLSRTVVSGEAVYANSEPLFEAAPRTLVLDVPGAEFPAFTGTPVPDAAPLEGIVIDGDERDANTRVRWTPGEPDTFVFFFLGGLIDRGPTGSGGDVVDVSCFVVDDGEFALPDDAREKIGDRFDGLVVLARSALTTRRRGDALLLVRNTFFADED